MTASTSKVVDQVITERYAAYNADCVESLRGMPASSIDYSIFSPPFASLYTYSNSERDMGNARTFDEFGDHYGFLCEQLFRVMKPGRLFSFHCMDLPLTKERDGVIGLRDFRGELIRMMQAHGFILHSQVVIWKDPVTAMQRTKAIGLLYKQLRKDSAMSRQGIPDYLVTMRKPGVNPEPVTKTHESFPVGLWQRYASPVWMDINQSDTLQRESAREDKDERHICCLQLGVIERAVTLWTNPGDLVLSPFMGIGSEGHVALKMGRRFIGCELKASYYKQAVANLKHAETLKSGNRGLFDEEGEGAPEFGPEIPESAWKVAEELLPSSASPYDEAPEGSNPYDIRSLQFAALDDGYERERRRDDWENEFTDKEEEELFR